MVFRDQFGCWAFPDLWRTGSGARFTEAEARLLAGVDGHPPRARVHFADGAWLTSRAARMGAGAPAGEGDIAVTFEATSPIERSRLSVRIFGLTAREAELLGHLVAGSDTHRIAQEMFLSEHTVQDHLESVFAKTGARNRRTRSPERSGAERPRRPVRRWWAWASPSAA